MSDVISKIRLRHLMPMMHNYLKNTSAKFHPNHIWNDRAYAF